MLQLEQERETICMIGQEMHGVPMRFIIRLKVKQHNFLKISYLKIKKNMSNGKVAGFLLFKKVSCWCK